MNIIERIEQMEVELATLKMQAQAREILKARPKRFEKLSGDEPAVIDPDSSESTDYLSTAELIFESNPAPVDDYITKTSIPVEDGPKMKFEDTFSAESVVMDKYFSSLKQENKELRGKLFPYADETEISGMSWNGFYLIGNKASIRELKRLENVASQVESWRSSFNNYMKSAADEIEELKQTISDLEVYKWKYEELSK